MVIINMVMVNLDGTEKDLGRVWRMDKDPIADGMLAVPTCKQVTVEFEDGSKVRYEKAELATTRTTRD